jgi:deoxyribodipyrimidine photo-lyase
LTFNPTIENDRTIFWFRRDLRLDDNAGLYHALRENSLVQPVFIFDTQILEQLEEKADRRVDFIHQSLRLIKLQLEELGSSLLVLHGDPVKIFNDINPRAVYTNHDYEPYARQRDESVKIILKQKGIPFRTFKDQVIFDRDEIVKDDNKPYTVFTPYSRKWKSKLDQFYLKSYPTEKYFNHLVKIKPLPFPTLKEIGFRPTDALFPDRIIRRSVIAKYEAQRDFPSINGTSRLSVHLRFGTVSIRKLVQLATRTNESWLNELIWREFYQMILWHFNHVSIRSFKPAYDQIEWRNDPDEFHKWCEGNTGYPMVDAGMRELNATGFMHNRVRMITASFLTKHLLIDWRWGEAYFASKLLDYDLASNNGGWQWAAGSGCDAAPYFRIFNPEIQAKKFDPQLKYIKKWIPEFESADYPQPIVEHKFARERAVRVYKMALQELSAS